MRISDWSSDVCSSDLVFCERESIAPASCRRSFPGPSAKARKGKTIMYLTEDQQLFRDAVRKVAEKEIAPMAAEIDDTDRFPKDLVPIFGDMGLTIGRAAGRGRVCQYV